MRGVELTAAPTLSRVASCPGWQLSHPRRRSSPPRAQARCAVMRVLRSRTRCSLLGKLWRSCGTAPRWPSERARRALRFRRSPRPPSASVESKRRFAGRGSSHRSPLLSTTHSGAPPHAPFTRLWRAACCALPEAGARAFPPRPRPPARLRPALRVGPVYLHEAGHDVRGAGRLLGGHRRAWVAEPDRLGARRGGHRDGLLLLLRRGLRRRGRADKTVRSREFSIARR